eukprot:9770180-Heterocapsa_arctica.AAC.1
MELMRRTFNRLPLVRYASLTLRLTSALSMSCLVLSFLAGVLLLLLKQHLPPPLLFIAKVGRSSIAS